MATFEEQYEQLFGKKLTYSPIDTSPYPALDLSPPQPPSAQTVAAENGDTALLDTLRSVQGTPAQPNGDVSTMDYVKNVGAGAMETAGALAGAGEYGARKLEDPSTVGGQFMTDVRETLGSARTGAYDVAADITQSMSPEAQQRLVRQWLTLDPAQTLWQGSPMEAISAVGLKFSRSLPATVATLLPASRMFRAGMTPGALAYLGASEGTLSMGGIANGIAQEIEQMTPEELTAESQRYQQLVQGGLDEDSARQQLITEAQGAAPLIGGVLVGAISSAAGRYLEPIFTKDTGANFASRFAQGFAAEAPQEAGQSAVEQYVQNVAAHVYDEGRRPTEGLAEATVEGGVIGGLTGGGFSMVAGQGPQQPAVAPPAPGAPPQQPRSALSFPTVFGTGGRQPAPPQGDSFTDVMGDDGVTPEQRVALNIRADQMMDELPMGEPYQGEPDTGRGDPAAIAVRNEQLDLQKPYNDYQGRGGSLLDVLRGAGQTELPLQRRERGYGTADVPSAEPLVDIEAQLADMQDPNSERMGVYLSPDNMASVGATPLLSGVGVRLENFDGKGGTLIARDSEAAETLTRLRDEGTDMQEVLGLATGAGSGKPSDGQYAVQQLTGSGAVIRESLVATPEEAEQLQERWGENTRILTPEQAIQRRGEMIKAERQQRLQPNLGQGDLFRQGQRAAVGAAPAATPLTAGQQPRTATRGFRVSIKGDEANSSQDFDTFEEAEPVYDEMVAAGLDAQLLPVRERGAPVSQPVGEAATEAATPTRSEQLKAKADVARKTRRQVAKLQGQVGEEVIESAIGAKTPTRAAARVLGEATRQAAGEEQQRVGGFYPPDALEFDKPEHEERYRGLFDKLTTNELRDRIGTGTNPEGGPLDREADRAERTQLLDELGKLRQISKPRRRTERTVKAATELAPQTGTKREVEQKAEREAPNEKDYLSDLPSLTDDEIDALAGEQLEEVYHRTARYVSGRNRHVQLSYEGGGAERPSDQIAEGEEQVAVQTSRTLTLQKILDKYDSQKKTLIRRAQNAIRRRKHGGKSKAAALTRTAKKTHTVPRRHGAFDTSVLTRETSKKDESRADRMKRRNEAKRARNSLEKSIAKTAKHIEALSNGKYSEYAQARNPETGDLTQGARDMLTGRMYFRTVADFGQALIKSGNDSASTIVQMGKVDEFLQNAIKMDPEDFARTMSNLARAEVQEQIVSIPVGDADSRAVRATLSDPEARAAWTAKTNQKLRTHAAMLSRLNDVWKKDSYYRSIVGPLMFKFADSTWENGWPSYRPTEKELQALQFAMRLWHNTSKEDTMYQPIRRFFGAQGLGFEFNDKGDLVIPRDANGDYDYHPTDSMLNPLYRARFGGEVENIGEVFPTRQAKTLTTEREIRFRKEQREEGQQRADRRATIEQFGKYAQANRIIEAFRARVANPKTTVPGLVRAEERLIRVLKAIGVWQQTPSPKIGKVKTRLGERTYRVVGPRLISKELSKEDARELMLKFQPVPLPKSMAEDPDVVARGEQKLDEETEFFMKEIGPQDNIESFRKVGEEISRRLSSDFNAKLRAHELLQLIANNLPDTHVYNQVARKLLSLSSTNVPISWNYREKVDISNLGKTKFDHADPFGGPSTYILINKAGLNHNWREQGRDPAAALLHTLLHESVHVATMHAVVHDRNVHNAVRTLQSIAQEHQKRHGVKLAYGIRETDHPAEFVAEAFSNTKFQNMLKNIRVERTNLWHRLWSIVRGVLGLDSQEIRTAYDAVMVLANNLFTNQQYIPSRGAVAVAELNETIKPLVGSVLDRSQQTMGALNSVWERAKSLGAPLSAMTMEQLRDTYAKHFGDGNNSMWRYMRAFFQRNAENSRLMEDAEKMSRRWTELTEQDGGDEHALEFSRLSTEATLKRVHADLPLTHKANEHLTDSAIKAEHAKLHARFNALPDEWQKQYSAVRKYYDDSLKLEVALMAQNALRAILTQGDAPAYTPEAFDKKYTPEVVAKLTTKEKMQAEFADLDPELRDSVLEITTLPATRKGPYFPLMRYGEYVVGASKVVETKTFADIKAAREFAAKKRAADPTVDFRFQTSGESVEVSVLDKEFITRESRSEAKEARDELVAKYGEENVSTVQLKADYAAKATIQSGSALRSILDKLEGNSAAQAAIKNFYLRSLADSSFRKHEINRKNRKGVDYDLQHRNFTNYAKQSAYYTSQLQYGWRMADALAEMQKFITEHRDETDITTVRLGEIRGEIKKRDEMATDVEEVPKLIRRGSELSQFMLLFSPSYWMINATQPYMVALPWLAARSSWGAAGAAMTHAQKLILSPLVTATTQSWGGLKAVTSKMAAEKAFGVLEQVKEQIRARGGDRADNYIKMLEALRRESIVDMSWVTELRDIAEGRDASVTQRVLDATRVMAHLTEVNNRIVTALAAYDLRFNEAQANEATRDQAHDIAIEFAKSAVSKTMFNYSSGNKPRLFQAKGQLGRYAPWVFQFMQYPQHMYAMMIDAMYQMTKGDPAARRIARRTLAGIFATHLAAGGIIGASLQPIKWAIGLTMMLFGDDDEPYTFTNAMSGATFDRMIEEAASTVLGSEIGGVLSRGLPTAVGTDLSSRMSIGTLYYLDLKTDTAESTIGSLAAGVAGPLVGIGLGWLRGLDYLRQGEYQKAAETLYPKILKDFSKFQRYASEGLVNASGDTVLPANTLSPWQLFLQAVGFAPEQMANFYERQAVIQDAKRYGESRKDLLVQRFRRAAPGERSEILREVSAFNKAHPSDTITRSTLIRAIQGKAERESSFRRYGAALRGKDVLYADEADYLEED